MVATTDRASPYVGPRPYTRQDHAANRDLYGREAEVESLFNILISQRIVLLYSPSGAGKTSLIEAALVPRLQSEGFAVLPTARVGLPIDAVVEDSVGNNRYVRSALTTLGADIAEPPLLDAFLNNCRSDSSDPQLLILDQFEEVLIEDPTDLPAKQAFFQQLGAALRDRERWALISMREDYVAGLDPYLRFVPGQFGTRFRLELLSPQAALQAIAEPAAAQHVDFTTVADELVRELSMMRVQRPDGTTERVPGPFVEPVQLQVVCVRIWEQLQPEAARVERQDVEAVGDVDQALSAYYADRVASTATRTGVAERRIREWVHTQLITAQGIRSQVLQGIGESAGLDNGAIDALVDAHLVRAEPRRGLKWYELAHDRLVEPVERDNTRWFQKHLQPFQRDASEWESQGHPARLLLRGQGLRDATRWERAHPTEMSATEREFLGVSRAAQYALEHRLNRIIQVLAVVALVIAGACAVLLVVASTFAETSDVRQLAFTAQQQSDPELTLLLATQAAIRKPLPEVDSTLRQAFADSHLRLTLRGRAGALWQAVFSLDGSSVFTAGQDDMVRRWDARDGAQLSQLSSADDGYFCGIALSPDGSRIATTNSSASAHPHIWSATTFDLITTLDVTTQQVCPVQFSPDGKKVVTGGVEGIAHISDAGTGRELVRLAGPRATVWTASFSPDGSRVVTGSSDGIARVWDAASGEQLEVLAGHDGNVWTAVYSPDGSRIATAGDDETARIWNSITGKQLATLSGHTDTLTTVAFSPDGNRVVTASHDSTARIWDVNSGQLLLELRGHVDGLRSAAFSPDGNRVVTASEDGTARIWDVSDGQAETLALNSGEVWSAAFSPNGSEVVATSGNGTARIWNPHSGDTLALDGHTGNVWNAAFSSDGARVATAGSDHAARIWDAATGALLATLPVDYQGIRSVAFSPDGAQLATVGDDGRARIWDAVTGQLTQAPFGDPGLSMRSVAFSRDGKQLAMAGTNKVAEIWDVGAQAPRLQLEHGVVVRGVAFDADGKRLVTASVDHNAQIWDTATGQRLLTLRGHSGPVWSADFNPSGTLVVTASEDGTARLWDAETGRQVLILRGHSGPVRSARFSPDGTEIVTAGSDGTVAIYQGCELTCSTDELVKHARLRSEATGRPDLSTPEKTQYLPDAPFWVGLFEGRT
jgi:WD40 repeat protein